MPSVSRCGVGRGLLLAASCLIPAAASAQVQSLQAPSREYSLPTPELPAAEEPERILPPVPPRPDPRRVGSGRAVRVDAFVFQGNTVFSDEELARVVAPYTGRELASEELEAAREALTRFYIDRGYVSSGAVVPDQELVDGVVRIELVEGRLADVVVSGTESFRASYFEKRLRRYADRPLRIQDLEERLQVFEQDPRIEHVAAQLGPGDARGDAVLRIVVEEAPPYDFGLEWSNDTPPSLGEQTGRVGARYSNVLGVGDDLAAVVRATEGLLDLQGQVRVPVNVWDTQLEAHVRSSNGAVVEGPFKSADIESEALTVGLSIIQPVWRTRATTAQVALVGDWRRSQTHVGGTALAFPGSGADPNTGISTLTALRLAGEWLHRERNRVVGFRQYVSFGLPVLRHTDNPNGQPDGLFVSSLSQLRVALRMPEYADMEVVFRADAQFASAPLLPLEQIGAGGMATVRGYAENELVRDEAVITSLELRFPVFRTASDSHVVQVAPFLDFARAWSEKRREFDQDVTLPNESLLGAGVGLRYRLQHSVQAELYWGVNLTDDASVPSSAQEHGLHFRLRVLLP